MAKKIKNIIDEVISSIDTPWQISEDTAYKGERVEEFLKKEIKCKIGYACWSPTVDNSNYYHLWGFYSKTDYTEYIADPEGNAHLLLLDEPLPISTVQGDSYASYLFSTLSSSANIIVSGNSLKVPLRFCAVRNSSGERLNVGIPCTLVIQRMTSSESEYKTVKTISNALPSTDYADTENMTEVEIGDALTTGKQKIRIRASFMYEDENGQQKQATSTYVAVGLDVTQTTLDLTCQLNYQTPLLSSSYKDRGFPISYMVYGAVAKTLHLSITGDTGSAMPEITYPLSAGDDSTVINKNITDTLDTYKLLSHGVKTVKAWLTCDDGLGGTIKSRTLVNRFMVIGETGDFTKPYLMLQNVITEADNYAQTDICDYAVFSPRVDENGNVTNNGDNIKVTFYLTDYAEVFPDDNPDVYFQLETNVSPGTQNTLNTTIEIETESEAATLPSYFRVYRQDEDGNLVNFMEESQGDSLTIISVDNSESYAPKAGATFLLNPKTRNNSEANPARILNAKAHNAEIESTWQGFGFVNDGWVTSEYDGQKILRIPAGARLNFKYNPFSQFLTTPDSAMTLEMVFASRNVTNEEDPIISLFENIITKDADGNSISTPRGLRMKPITGNIYTKSNTINSETDFHWAEGTRTHIAINIHNAVAPNKGDVNVPDASSGLNVTATKIPLIRVFINGDPERELRYSITDSEEFCTALMSNGGFTLGQDGAGLDIYTIRCYQNNALEANEVNNNHISTMPTTAEKQEAKKRNNLLTSGKIDIDKVRTLGRNCLIWHGTEPYHELTSKQKGWWEIYKFSETGEYLPEYSGTICKQTASLVASRQGSTANTYWDSNLQTKCGDVTETINVLVSNLHSSLTVTEPYQDDNGNWFIGISGGNLGKLDPVQSSPNAYPYDPVTKAVRVPDGWIDGYGKYRGMGYQVKEGTPFASKLVNKRNIASSMQSHLTGGNNLYNDLHTLIVGKNSLQQACPTARVSKYTEPFYFFVQATGASSPVFRGLGTFGAGKMDKPTWGYVKKLHPGFCMIEGSDNNFDLTDARVPFTWNMPDCPENVTYDADGEGFVYNGKQCLDFDGGATESDDTPKANLIEKIQNAWNFLYLHSPMVSYYKGTFAAFQVSDQAKDIYKKYWCTDGEDAYLLKRYDFVNSRWVDAGLWDDSVKAWSKVDIRTDSMTAATYEASANKAQYAALNEEIKAAIVSHCKANIGSYFKPDSLKFNYAFLVHFLAGTDNCSKNTYFVLDPATGLFEMHCDDVDTILPTDNNGRATKPYYLDRMHPYVDGDMTTSKYEGMNSVLFNLIEAMWENTLELQAMMKRIFTAMESLVSDSDYLHGWTGGSKVSVWGCLWKYFFYVQHYFSEIAYIETARLAYEYPEMLGFVSSGAGARGVKPITQSSGSLLQCELQFMTRRLVYMGSYAAWGPFYDGKTGALGIAEASDSFSMQAYHLPDSATSNNNYTFNVTPHQYIYPTALLGQTNIDPHKRVAPGETFALNLGDTTSNDTGMAVLGINFYRSIGNIGDLSTTPANTLSIKGNRLTEFIAEPQTYYTDSETGKQTPAFRPGGLVFSAQNLKTISLKGMTATSGAIDLSALKRLAVVDIRQTAIQEASLPQTSILESVKLPASTTSLLLYNQPKLSTLELEGYSNLERLTINNSPKINTKVIVNNIFNSTERSLKNLSVRSIKWTEVAAAMLTWMMTLTSCSLDGTISTVANDEVPYDTVIALIDRFGNIQSEDNSLYIEYKKIPISSISVDGAKYIRETGLWTGWSINRAPLRGNNIAVKDGKPAVKWTITGEGLSDFADIVDDTKGTLNVKKVERAIYPTKFNLNVTMTLTDGTQLEYNKTVGFARRAPRLNDFAYADGTFDDEYDEGLDLVGVVISRVITSWYDEEKGIPAQVDLVVYSKENVLLKSTDGTYNTSSHVWGLYPDDNTNGFSSEIGAEINEATGMTDCFDTSLPNLGRSGIISPSDASNNDYRVIRDTFLDDTTEDGYAVPASGTAASDLNSEGNTDVIMAHAQKVINMYLGESLPTTPTELADAMQSLVNKMKEQGASNAARYRQMYYPAIYSCRLYEPSVSKGTLADCYKRGRWSMPSFGIQARIYNFFYNSCGRVTYEAGGRISTDYADEAPQTEARTPLFANILKRMGGTNKGFTMPNNSNYWSSSEYSRNFAWYVYFSSGHVNYNSYKYDQYVTRAVAAFTYDV